MPATVLAERVGWSGSPSWFRENVARLRPEQRRPDPADRLVWAPGDAAQCDLWFPPKRIPLEDGTTSLLPVLVMVPAHSRFICGRMIPTRQTPDLLLGSWSLIEGFGRVPRRLIWDNETGIGRRGRLAAGVAEFCGTLATRVHQLKPRDPESKGVVERRNGFFETSFMPGRSFDLAGGLQRPVRRVAGAGEPACGAHAPGPPDRSRRRRSGSDAGVAADPAACRLVEPDPARAGLLRARRSNDYSVDPTAIGRLVTVTADLERVRVRLDGRVVADHARVWARHMTVTDPAHVATAQRAARSSSAVHEHARRRLAGAGSGRLRPGVRRSTG